MQGKGLDPGLKNPGTSNTNSELIFNSEQGSTWHIPEFPFDGTEIWRPALPTELHINTVGFPWVYSVSCESSLQNE